MYLELSDPAGDVETSTQQASPSRGALVKSGVEFVQENMDRQKLRALTERQGNDNLRSRSQECINVHILSREWL